MSAIGDTFRHLISTSSATKFSTFIPFSRESHVKQVEVVKEEKDNVFNKSIDWSWLPVWDRSYRGAKHTIVLCHGLWGFDKLGFDSLPRLQLLYWGNIETTLKKLGTNVVVSKVPSTGTIAERAKALHSFLDTKLDAGSDINLIAHSMV